jgi:DNA-directed RNA polymerase specialized sigma24 family protein
MSVTTRKKKVHYVNNKTLFEEMQKYKAARILAVSEEKTAPKIPRYIGECLLMICTKLATKPNFASYTYKDEMIADGIENCIAAVDNFDPDRYNNPFAYFTQIAWNAFIRRISKEKKQSYIKHKNYQNSFLMDIQEEGVSMNTNQFSDDIISSFETKLNEIKIVKKKKTGIEVFETEELIDENSSDNGYTLGDSQ